MKGSVIRFQFIIPLVGLLLMTACSDISDSGVPITIPSQEDDECCSLIEETETQYFLSKLSEVTQLSQSIGDYTIRVYSSRAELTVGYNDLYFAVEKNVSGRHVKDIEFSELQPLMTMNMSGMAMQHSTPIAEGFEQVVTSPIYHTWISLLMASNEENGDIWELSYRYRVKEFSGVKNHLQFPVKALPEGQTILKSFKYGDTTYYLSLAAVESLVVGDNVIKAYVSKQSADKKTPYAQADQKFTIDTYPTMPDMGNHTSPNNEPLTLQDDGSYQGKLNLTMTGIWDIHLHVKDAAGKTVAGGELLSDLYWTISI